MAKIIIFTAGLFGKTGICTWVHNFCANMYKDHSILVLSNTYSDEILKSLKQYAECQVYDKNREYNCDLYIHNYQDNEIRQNIKAEKTYVMLHCDYAAMSHMPDFDINQKYIAVSVEAARNMRNAYGLDCRTIAPFVMEYRPKPILKLVSATRLTTEKGYLRMVKLCELLKAHNVRFQWLVFAETPKPIADIPEFICMGPQPNDVVMDYMFDADYVVQLSDHEGFCYSVHESLSMGTPCIVSDIPVFQNVIKNGYNGYRIPLDMSDVPMDKILDYDYYPCNFEYDRDAAILREKWGKVLNEN